MTQVKGHQSLTARRRLQILHGHMRAHVPWWKAWPEWAGHLHLLTQSTTWELRPHRCFSKIRTKCCISPEVIQVLFCLRLKGIREWTGSELEETAHLCPCELYLSSNVFKAQTKLAKQSHVSPHRTHVSSAMWMVNLSRPWTSGFSVKNLKRQVFKRSIALQLDALLLPGLRGHVVATYAAFSNCLSRWTTRSRPAMTTECQRCCAPLTDPPHWPVVEGGLRKPFR